MKRRIVTGNFNVEEFWSDKKLATVPRINDSNTDIINECMQELMFVFCNDEDVLLTRERFDSSLKEYLSTIGFGFKDISLESYNNDKANSEIFLLDKNNLFKNIYPQTKYSLELFGSLESAKLWSEENNIEYIAPDYEIVKKVNSKQFSYELRKKLNHHYNSFIIENFEEFDEISKLFSSQNKAFIIKELLGVSGKGNFIVNSELLLKYFCRYLNKQINNKKISFLLEEFLPKKFDFSCVANISQYGDIRILGVQKIVVLNTAYVGTQDSDRTLNDLLYKSNYFYIIENACKELYLSGYYGPVCFDSMCLMNGKIIPIIEINARYSMSQIKISLDNKYKKDGSFSLLSQININNKDNSFNTQELLKSKIIFNGYKGVLPLSSNAVCSKIYSQSKGRLYYYILADNKEDVFSFENSLKEMVKRK